MPVRALNDPAPVSKMPRLNNPSLAHAAAHAEQPDAHPGEMQKRRGGQGAFPDLRLRWKFLQLNMHFVIYIYIMLCISKHFTTI